MSSGNLSFVRRPKWIIGHVIALVAIVVFVAMGFWQLRRLADRQDFNALLTERATAVAVELDSALDGFGPDPDNLELRAVRVTGEYRQSEEIILLSRSFNGLSGHHVLTPLYLTDGTAVIIDRGWVGIDLDEPGLAQFAPPSGRVTVEGVLRKTETRGSFGPIDPADGVLTRVARVDLGRIGQQIEGELLGVYVQLLDQQPEQTGGLPAIAELPEPSEGPHRGYAVQWFLFAAVTAVGYPILLWRTAATPALPSMPSFGP